MADLVFLVVTSMMGASSGLSAKCCLRALHFGVMKLYPIWHRRSTTRIRTAAKTISGPLRLCLVHTVYPFFLFFWRKYGDSSE
ncbi:hypothetical protein DFH94DRAFT_747594 [Russula ochroleuca]|uniref:Secreted protein n=1 Tax=Russula ochroleuca TaxID=152965 RepID=A0A9P5MUP7_9AGAM|nr:hypothetical protein DFH94DRAFT_747594 [Russula ochroleuca]